MLNSNERVNPHPGEGWRFGQSAKNGSRTAISEETFGNVIALMDALIIAVVGMVSYQVYL